MYVLAGTHIGIDACLRCECQWSTLPSQLLLLLPGRRASLFLINLLWKRGKSLEKRKKLGWSDLYRRSKIFNWMVHAVSTGDKPMGHWLLAVPAWWSLAENEKKTFCRPLKCVDPPGKSPVCLITNQAPAPCDQELMAFCQPPCSGLSWPVWRSFTTHHDSNVQQSDFLPGWKL